MFYKKSIACFYFEIEILLDVGKMGSDPKPVEFEKKGITPKTCGV